MLNVLAFLQNFRALRREDRGVTTVEYALLLVLIVAVVAIGVTALGTGLSSTFSNMASHF
jgi:Flp pilus assembly pilin Flp